MEKFIEVYDNLLSPQLEDEIYDIIFHRKVPYDFLYNILDHSIKDKPYVGMQHVLYDYEDQPTPSIFNWFLLNILYKLNSYTKNNLEYYFRGRIFIQPPLLPTKSSGIHVDFTFDHLVCLYYVNNVDGDTIFYEDDKKTEIKRISPKKGRIAFFSGNIPHCSTSPKELPRSIINFNFINIPK
jgi:hypothetical protein